MVVVAGVRQPERVEEPLAERVGVGPPRDGLDDGAQHGVARVGVGELAARLEVERVGREPGDEGGRGRRHARELGVAGEGRVPREPARVREQVADPQAVALLGRVVQVARDGRVEVDLARLDELHHERGRELLGERPDPVPGVGRVGDGPGRVGEPEATLVDDGVAGGHQDGADKAVGVVGGRGAGVEAVGEGLSRRRGRRQGGAEDEQEAHG